MVTIFAGRDPQGVVRYLNEVPSGLACACSCLVCGSALVAKKGAINDWHFAHESGQTNPQCQVGAENLLRELAVECLRAYGLPAHPKPCSTTVWAGHLSQQVIWAAEVLAIQWSSTVNQRQVAVLELRGGATAALMTQVEGEETLGHRLPGDAPALVVSVPMPPAAAFRSKQDLIAHIRQHMGARWLALPDTDGSVQATRLELQRRHEADTKARTRTPPQGFGATGRWNRQGAPWLRDETPVEPEPAVPVAQPPVQDPPWAWDRKQHASFYCYKFHDGSQWLLYETNSVGWLLRPWPGAQEGWDETLPPRLGRADQDLLAYKVGYPQFFMAVRDYQAGMKNTTDPGQVAGFFA